MKALEMVIMQIFLNGYYVQDCPWLNNTKQDMVPAGK